MANVFNAAEIIDIGIEKEKRRRDFYGLVAAQFRDREMADLFTRLRDWEDQHIRKFTDIRNSVTEDETTESYKGELAAYMNALVDNMLYESVVATQFAQNVKTPLQAIRFGMVFEKDAILFFNELLKYMTAEHRERVIELIDEEKRHLVYLSELKTRYE